MTARGTTTPAVGFLTVRRYDEIGLIGGYLVLNTVGRPLEFHCTAPVKPNRAQEILYGPTLEPYLYGEQIGQTLLKKGRHEPLFVCVDEVAVLAAREFTSIPLVWVDPQSEPDAGSGAAAAGSVGGPPTGDRPVDPGVRWRRDGGRAGPPVPASLRLTRFRLNGLDAAVLATCPSDQADAGERWQPHAEQMSLCEPFQRLSEAIDEAQRVARGSSAP